MRHLSASPSKRRVLQSIAAVSVTAVAGCVNPFFGRGDSCGAGTDFSATPATDADVATYASSNVGDLAPIVGRLVEDALAEGETSYSSYHEPDLHTEYVVRDGEQTYYRVAVQAGESVETTGYRYEVAFGDDVPAPADGDRVVAFADLPRPDRESFLGVLGKKAAGVGKASGAHFTVTFAYADEATQERSAFVPRTDVDYVRWQGTDLRLTFDEEHPVSVVTYSITADRIAESTAEFADRVLEDQGVVLDGLSADQRDIVEQAIDGGYSTCKPYSEAFHDILKRLSTGEHDFASFVRYAGTWYISRVSEWHDD